MTRVGSNSMWASCRSLRGFTVGSAGSASNLPSKPVNSSSSSSPPPEASSQGPSKPVQAAALSTESSEPATLTPSPDVVATTPFSNKEVTYFGKMFSPMTPEKASRDLKHFNDFYVANGINVRSTRQRERFVRPPHARRQAMYQERKDHFNDLVKDKMDSILALYGIRRGPSNA